MSNPAPVYLMPAAAMRDVDRVSIHERGIPGIDLMNRAGRFMAGETVRAADARRCSHSALVLCGRGNNGGDGFVIARELARQDWDVITLLTANADRIRGDARLALDAYIEAGGEIVPYSEALLNTFPAAPVIVDAVFGTGVRGPLPDADRALFRQVNAVNALRVAADIPSGVNGDTGEVCGDSFRADLTCTVGAVKTGMINYPALSRCGRILCDDIGFPADLLAEHAAGTVLTAPGIAGLLPRHSLTDHKGNNGRVHIAAGSRHYPGAAVLCCLGAAAAGAGLITLHYPDCCEHALYGIPPDVIRSPLPAAADGGFSRSAADRLNRLLAEADADAVLAGPGLGRGEGTDGVISACLSAGPPLVLDADGLNVLTPARIRTRERPTVLTPHPGEAARLLRVTADSLNSARLDAARSLAEAAGCTAVLKGAGTVIAGPDRAAVNLTGNPLLARGGSGDILAGMTAGFIGRGLHPEAAARTAVYLHGLAAEAASDDGLATLSPSNLPAYVSRVYARTLTHG